jgi:hypothetical protein
MIAPPLVDEVGIAKPCTTAGRDASARTTAALILDAAFLAEPACMLLASLMEFDRSSKCIFVCFCNENDPNVV